MTTALSPDLMPPAERLAEIGEILAAGILRLRAKQRHSDDRGELSFDFPGNQSVHARTRSRGENAC